MKRFFKWLGLGVLTTIVLATALGLHEWHATKPLFFRAFLDRTMIKMALDQPETLTNIGVLDAIGITGHNAKLNDNSPASGDELYQTIKEVKATLATYSDDQLNDNQRLSKEIAMWLLELGIASEPYRYHNYPVNQLFGVQNGYPSFMDAQHRIPDIQAAEHYIARLKAVETKFQQTLDGLKLREEKGIVPPRFVIERVLEEMSNFVSQAPQENILYVSLDRKLGELTALDADIKTELLARASEAINAHVYPAYTLLIDYFTLLLPKAGTQDGFWRLPGGELSYELSLKFFTTTDYSPDEIHNLGLSEVARIQKEMLSILAEQGFDTTTGFKAAIEQLKAEESFYYPDSQAGREQILEDYRLILDEIDAKIGDAFNIRPKAGMEVRRIPEFKEKTAPGAYYEQPAMDGSRPGVFFANLYDIKATPKYGMRTLAYHEGIPGHHFQIAVAMELEGLPVFRTLSPFTAYVEGWALYAEQLAWEMGFQDDPYDNLGRLQAELFRAVRLVVDTGIHAKRWSREEAIVYMGDNTGMADSDVVSEIERYIVMPGQATSYKVGMMKILAEREKARRALGDKFKLAEFHDVVLKNGAVPLAILERLVDQYIAEKR